MVGAGASGLMAARRAGSALKRAGRGGVLLAEGGPKAGKKLLATGNGRCNLTNLRIAPERYHGDVEEAAALLAAYPAGKVLSEFEKLGLLCRTDSEGRAYPNSLQAAAVLRALRVSCAEAGVETVCGFETVSITPERSGFLLRAADGRELWTKACILACGGMASPKHSCGEKGYRLAESLGHSVTELSPSLAPLKSPRKMLRALKGMRCKAGAALYRDGRKLYAESGEVLFGDGTLSGICVFNLSARLRQAGRRGNLEVRLDLLEEFPLPELLAYLKRLQKEHPGWPAGELFSGVLNLRVGEELVKSLGIGREKPLSALAPTELEQAAEAAKDLRFPVTGPGPWESAQVTAGGVPLREVDPRTMESKKVPGLFLTGELLDVDGDCGGYNLHWAWATGMAAGDAAVRFLGAGGSARKQRGGNEG